MPDWAATLAGVAGLGDPNLGWSRLMVPSDAISWLLPLWLRLCGHRPVGPRGVRGAVAGNSAAIVERSDWARTEAGVRATSDLSVGAGQDNGEAVAIGYPFGATDARDLSQAVKEPWSHPAVSRPSSASTRTSARAQ